MIEEQASVTRVEDGLIYVKSTPASACQSCSQKTVCGTTLYAKVLPKREMALRSQLPLHTGDHVIVGIEETHLVRASILMYFLPLVVMLLVAGFVDAGDVITAIVSIISLFITLFIIHRLQYYFLHYFMTPPKIIRKC